MEDKIIKFKATVNRKMFDNGEDYKIYSMNVNTNIYKNIIVNKQYGTISLVGNIPDLIPEREYEITATVTNSKKYGINYKMKTICRPKPTDIDSSYEFLKEILSEKQAKVLLDVYPDIVDKIINNDLNDIDLNKTKGIKQATFDKIKEKVTENFTLIDFVKEFGGLLDMGVCKKLYTTYGSLSTVRKMLKQHPYKCLCNLSRVGFKTADSILLKLEENSKDNEDGFKFNFELKESKERLKACLDFIMQENEANGNTKMKIEEARKECGKLVPECVGLFVELIKSESDTIHVDNETKSISSKIAYNTEMYIKDFIKEMLKNNVAPMITNYESFRNVEGFNMTDDQLNTSKMMCENSIGILTGFGGTGKSFSVKGFLNLLDSKGKTYLLMTPTGASSKVLANYTGRECGTIHRQLGYHPNGEDNPWEYNKTNKLDVDYVIIDEFSMVDIYLFSHVIDAIDTNKTKLLMIYDPYQLPSVGCGNLAQDFLSSGMIPVNSLTKIFRYAEGGLATVASDIRSGNKFINDNEKKPKMFGERRDFAFLPVEDDKIIYNAVKIYEKLIKSGYTDKDIMILSSQNVGDKGTKAINKMIQSYKQKQKKTNFLMRGETKFHLGDKVIQVVNNYKAKNKYGEEKENIFNGNSGVIVDVSWDNLIVDFGDKEIMYTKDDLSQLELGYCITTHKSQGDSSKQVVVLAPKAHTFMLNSNLLYVATTRAKERCFMLGSPATINRAIKKKINLTRDTYLHDLNKIITKTN